jgi:site-specific recombinase XerD
MATVAIVFRKDKVNKKGQSPIHFRIIKNRRPVYIASGIAVSKEHWDEKNLKVKSGHKNSARLNSYLSNKHTEIYNSILENEIGSKTLTSSILKQKVFGQTPQKYLPFADKVIENYRKEGRLRSYYNALTIINKFRDFCKSKNITFQDITPAYLVKYESYLRTELGNKTNTIHKNLKFHRKVFNDAIRQDVIGYGVSPFRKYQLKLEKTQRDYLTEEELLSIEGYKVQPGSRLELHKNMFIFASYAGGLRISDMLKLQWKDFDGTHLHLVIKKTGVQVSIKVPNKGLEILQSLKGETVNPVAFIFPMFPKGLDLDNPEAVDTAISRCTAYINKNLKIIAKQVGIRKNLSFHISRHSFAVRALRKGISIDKVSKILAHSNIRETQIYAKVVNEELDKAMDVFNS